MGKVQEYLEKCLSLGWKIAKRIDFPNTDMYNYHLVPANEDNYGYICMWCKGKNEFETQHNQECYHDDNYNGETLYETGYDKSTLYMGVRFEEV